MLAALARKVSRPRTMKSLRIASSAVLSVLIMAGPEVRGQTIPNPGFEADAFTVWPGYAGINGGISGWTFTGGAGLNPASGNPFADNGAIPQGSNVAFIQSGSNVFETLATTITGLTPGTAYTVRFRANQRAGYGAPSPSYALNGGAPVPFSAAPPVGGSNGYYYVRGTFNATAATAALAVSNITGGDTTLLVDDFSIGPASPVTSAWAVSPWLDDASSGISTQTLWAYRFGSASNATINGMTVPGLEEGDPAIAGNFTITGVPNVFPGDANAFTNTGSGSEELAGSFIYGGNPATVTLEGLAPGHTYVVSFLGVGFEAAGRIVTFSSGGQQQVLDEDVFGDNNGLRVDHTFVAVATTRDITITPQGAATFHLYALALRQPILVASTADSGTGSLRHALATAAARDGPDFIAFDPALSGQTIILASEILVDDSWGVILDATTLPGGLTIGNTGGHRHFRLAINSRFTLRGVMLTNGEVMSGVGGSILNGGVLTMTRCTLTGNSAGVYGGAIYNENLEGTVTLTMAHCVLSGNSAGNFGGAIYSDPCVMLTNCTLSGNSAGNYGGALFNGGGLTLTRCTLTGNSVTGSGLGGAILNNGTLTLTHCTFSGNSASVFGGAIYAGGPMTLINTIVAGNSAPIGQGADIYNTHTLTRAGASIVPSLTNNGGSFTGTGTISTADPLLAPPGNYGGFTQTMALRPGSPARNAATGSSATADQRGFPIVGVPDIGAYEVGTLTNCASYLAESLPATAAPSQITPEADLDGDGATNEQEWNALTDPANPASVLRIRSAVRSGGNLILTFPTVNGLNYSVWRSDLLTGTWIDAGLPSLTGNGANQSFTFPSPVSGLPKRFYRVQAGR